MSIQLTASTHKFSPAAAAMVESTLAGLDQDNVFNGLLADARQRIRTQLQPAQIEDPSDEDQRTAEALLQPLVEQFVNSARVQGLTLAHEPEQLLRQLLDDIFGFGPLAPYLADEEIEEIICNGPGDIWIIHATHGKERVSNRFHNAREMINFVNRVTRTGGRRLDKANPKIDAHLRDGSRLHAVMEPVTVNVPVAMTIRRHRLVAQTIADLQRLGTVTLKAGEFLRLAVQARLNLIVSGSTASGKTNFVNALCDAADDGDRFIIIEDTPELRVRKLDVVQLCTRERAEEARAFSIADLVIEALRMRPDRIITGEARGPEVVDVLKAANTGHDGQMLTVHANSTRDVIQRLETMYLMSGITVPLIAIRRQIADAFQLVVFLKRMVVAQRSCRLVTEIAEIQPSQFMEDDKVVVQNIFEDKGQGLAWTGYFPERLARRMADRGITLRPDYFRN